MGFGEVLVETDCACKFGEKPKVAAASKTQQRRLKQIDVMRTWILGNPVRSTQSFSAGFCSTAGHGVRRQSGVTATAVQDDKRLLKRLLNAPASWTVPDDKRVW
jgi:hypothetical protein